MIDAEELRNALSYEEDMGIFRWRKIRNGAIAGKALGKYVLIKINRNEYLAHRLAWLYVYGVWPEGVIDHINGVPSDNRIVNLRDVSKSVNTQNQRKASKNNRAGILGIARAKSVKEGWIAQIRPPGGKTIYIGTYPTQQEAYSAYVAEKRRLHEGCTI